MKTIISISFLFLLSISLTAQSFNQEIAREGRAPILVGKINNKGLTKKPYDQWFTKNYLEYTPNQNIIDTLKNKLNTYTIKIFLGTWCGDSKREVPRFYKILNNSNFSLDRVTTIAVDHSQDNYKKSPGGEHEGLNIHKVPTFIFYKNGKEINRIVESPKRSLEEDMLTLLSKQYIPKYSPNPVTK